MGSRFRISFIGRTPRGPSVPWSRPSTAARRWARRACGYAGLALLAGCLRFSPFEVDLPDDEQHQNEKNVALLAARPRPPVSPDHPLTFAFLADTHDGLDQWKRIVASLNARTDLEFVVHGGDFTDFGSQQEYRWAFDVYTKLRVPFLMVAGNHDGLANGPRLWAKMFGAEDFVVRYAGVRFVFFNVNTQEFGHPLDLDWLANLPSDPGDVTTFVVAHQPPLSPPDIEMDVATAYWQALEAIGTRAYFYGHLHDLFGHRQTHDIAFAKVETAMDGAYYVVTTDGAQISLQACVYDDCVENGGREDEAANPGSEDPDGGFAPP